MIITAGSLVQLTVVNRHITAAADAQTQVGRAFLRLDGELRYAADLRVQTVPATGSAYPSLLYLSTADGAQCHTLSLVDHRLLRHRWPPGASVGPATVLAFGVSAVGVAVAPFAVTGGSTAAAGDGETGTSAAPKEATVSLAVTAGDTSRPTRRELRETFLAPNSLRGPHGAVLDDCLTGV
ncbi:MAG TPA: hypothetical protein VK453_04185 [Micromonosporaceae bacterium]|nr:hypothetical protein [Micromonosporaceae bacterium]